MVVICILPKIRPHKDDAILVGIHSCETFSAGGMVYQEVILASFETSLHIVARLFLPVSLHSEKWSVGLDDLKLPSMSFGGNGQAHADSGGSQTLWP